MKTRLITSGLGAILFFVLLFSPSIVFHIADVLVIGIAIFEVYSVCGMSKKPTMVIAGVLGAGMGLLFGLGHMGVIGYDVCLLAICVFVAYVFASMVFDYKRVKLFDAAVAFFAAVFMALPFSYIMPMREAENGMLLIIALFAGTWGSDGGAYFIGINFGKHKLSPVLSPKKSVEGYFGGILGSVVIMALYTLILNFVVKVECNEVMLILTGVGCSILGPIGDIATSAIKREFNVKDYGNIFPGHGGILDRFDSVILTTPFVYFMSQMFTLIGK